EADLRGEPAGTRLAPGRAVAMAKLRNILLLAACPFLFACASAGDIDSDGVADEQEDLGPGVKGKVMATDGLNVRAAPDTSSAVLKTLPNGRIVRLSCQIE